VLYKQTMSYFQPMLRQLKQREVPLDMLAGLWMIVTAIRERNYLHAYDIYMRLAIGGSAGVGPAAPSALGEPVSVGA
jgi:pre-mRNA-splicing factor 18